MSEVVSGIETMTSRERVIRTVKHLPVDRVPIDFGGHYSTGISAFAYWNLRKYLGLSTDHIEIVDFVQFLARVDQDILQRFKSDVMLLKPPVKKSKIWQPRQEYRFYIPEAASPYLLADGSYVVEKGAARMCMPAGGYFFDGDWLNLDDETEDQLIKSYTAEAEAIFKETEYYTMYIGYHAYFGGPDMDYLCNMLTDPNLIIDSHKQIHQRQLKHAGKIIDAMGEYVQAIAVNSDLGFQNGPMCDPAVYAQLCAPYLKKFCDFIHQNSNLQIFMHSCGAIEPFMPILIDCGIDMINPVQISAANMKPEHLKSNYGDRITFWGGGCDTQNVLNTAGPEHVKQHVRDMVNIFKPNGGFVFNQVHNIMGDIPPENIIAMYDAAYDAGFYT